MLNEVFKLHTDKFKESLSSNTDETLRFSMLLELREFEKQRDIIKGKIILEPGAYVKETYKPTIKHNNENIYGNIPIIVYNSENYEKIDSLIDEVFENYFNEELSSLNNEKYFYDLEVSERINVYSKYMFVRLSGVIKKT